MVLLKSAQQKLHSIFYTCYCLVFRMLLFGWRSLTQYEESAEISFPSVIFSKFHWSYFFVGDSACCCLCSQVGAALRPAFSADASPDITAKACQVTINTSLHSLSCSADPAVAEGQLGSAGGTVSCYKVDGVWHACRCAVPGLVAVWSATSRTFGAFISSWCLHWSKCRPAGTQQQLCSTVKPSPPCKLWQFSKPGLRSVCVSVYFGYLQLSLN